MIPRLVDLISTDPWSDPTFDEVWAWESVLSHLRDLKHRQHLDRLNKERHRKARLVRVPGPHQAYDFGRCRGSFLKVRSDRWLKIAQRMKFRNEREKCRYCGNLVTVSIRDGRLNGHDFAYGKPR